ncbi:MAG TPA: prepilin-type N-terminal cleavage/methylation domain-containing protein, partial [Isosphaeraceae bacterium]
MPTPRAPGSRAGFTLIELLVVIAIILIVSAATLPVVLPALSHRQIGDAARQLNATLAGARDAAIRSNEPRGIRLLPDSQFNGFQTPGATVFPLGAGAALASSRMIAIEPGPDYSEGRVAVFPPNMTRNLATFVDYANPPSMMARDPTLDPRLIVFESLFLDPATNQLRNPPTSWYWNIRQGDKIRIGESGHSYTVAGPMVVGGVNNPERFINIGPPGTVPAPGLYGTLPDRYAVGEYLFVANNQDDDGNGYIDDSFDGIDNDYNPTVAATFPVDPGFNGIDENGQNGADDLAELISGEYEQPERFLG